MQLSTSSCSLDVVVMAEQYRKDILEGNSCFNDKKEKQPGLRQSFALLIYVIRIRFQKWKQPVPVSYLHDRFKMEGVQDFGSKLTS